MGQVPINKLELFDFKGHLSKYGAMRSILDYMEKRD